MISTEALASGGRVVLTRREGEGGGGGGNQRGGRGRRQRREKVCTSGRDGQRWGVSVSRLQGREQEQVPSAERANALLPQEGRWWRWWKWGGGGSSMNA